jgi:hypothetical protein
MTDSENLPGVPSARELPKDIVDPTASDTVAGEKNIMQDKYLVFDPGLSTGWASFNQEGEITSKGILRGLDELISFLSDREDYPDVVIYEGYRVFGHKAKAHIGSKVEAVQAIGMIKVYASRWKAEIVEQPSSILSIAQLWSGVRLPSNHDKSHDIAAYNHGVYYLQKSGIRKSRLST